jgi:hypothetical protein
MRDAVRGLLRPRRAEIDFFDLFSFALFAALLIIALATFRDYAISNDEEVQHRYGQLIIAYYASGFADRSLFAFQNLYLYGGLFDVLAILIGHVIPADIYLIRHILCPLIGIGGIVATWATARLIAGPRAAALAAVILALCGPWYGGMFNHTKDIPFAAAMMGAAFFLLRASRDLPRPQLRDILLFGVLLGAALGQRATGLLLVGYVAVAVALHLPLRTRDLRTSAAFLMRAGLSFLPAFAIGYAIMIAAWPWASLELLNPIRAVFAFAHFHYPIRTLFAGKIYLMADVPRWYVPTYVLIKVPLVTFAGALFPLLACSLPNSARFGNFTAQARRELGLLAFFVAFPLVCQVAGDGPGFTGMRHFLFIVPPLAALAGIGFDALLSALARHRLSIAAAAFAALCAVFVWKASVLVRLHPDQYVSYNMLVGGLEGALRQYDTDYWVNVMPEAVDDLEGFLNRTDRDFRGKVARRYTVAVCGERLPFEKTADPRLKFTEDWQRADFFIAPTHMNCDRALDGQVIATVDRLGVPIGVVKDRRAITRPDIATMW